MKLMQHLSGQTFIIIKRLLIRSVLLPDSQQRAGPQNERVTHFRHNQGDHKSMNHSGWQRYPAQPVRFA